MCTSWLAVAFLLLVQPNKARAEDTREAVASLVRQLADGQTTQRDEAEKQLIHCGPAALDFLPPVDGHTPADVAERLDRIVEALQSAAAEAMSRGSLVTLEGVMPLGKALEQLESQTGNRAVGAKAHAEAVVKPLLRKTTYWRAMDQLLDQAGLTIDPYGGASAALTLVARPVEQRPRCGFADYGGVFRFEAVRVETMCDLCIPRVRGLMVRLEINWEPRVAPVAIMQPLDRLTALDERGNELPVADPEGVCPALVRRGVPAVEIDLPLRLPGRSTRRIASLKGSLTALLPGRLETFEFADLETARNVQQRKAKFTLILDQVRKNADGCEVLLRLRFDDAADSLGADRGWICENEAYLVDPRGRRVENVGAEATAQKPDEFALCCQFALSGGLGGCKFVYRTPVAIVQDHVAYELKDIPLP